MKKSIHESISEVYFGYNTILEVYAQLTANINKLGEIRKPAFTNTKGDRKFIMLLPSFNFIGGKEAMKLLRDFHLTKVKQNFFLFLRAGAENENLKRKRYNQYIICDTYARD